MRHSGVARFFAVLVIVLGITPFTAPFASFDLTDHDGALHGGWKAPTDPDDALLLPESAGTTNLLFAAVDLAENGSVDQLPTHRLIVAVLRL